jgi:prephenate dehydrogenase
MAFQFTKINQRKLDEVLKFAATHFSRHQVILRYLNITPELYAKIFNPLIEACYNSGFSYAAFN